MEQLLVEDASKGQAPDEPSEFHRVAVLDEGLEVEPGGVAPSYEEVDHATVTTMQQFL